MGNPPANNSIFTRNKAATLEAENLLWRALCDQSASARDYMASDAVMSVPERDGILSSSDLDSYLESMEPWTAFRIRDAHVVEVDMMATCIVYKLSLMKFQQGQSQAMTKEASASSTWRQTAGADWELCAHHLTYLQ